MARTNSILIDTKNIIYIVDDDEAIRDSLRLMLNLAGLQTQLFASGEEFLEAVVSPLSGCVLLDINMPGLSGLEVMKRLRDEGFGNPVVIVTGDAHPKIKSETVEAGAFAILNKPLRKQLLLDTVQQALDQHRAT